MNLSPPLPHRFAESRWIRSLFPLPLLLACFVVDSRSVSGQIPSNWLGGSGLWNDASRWDTTDFPENGNGGFLYNAIIASGNVDLNQNIQVENLNLSGGAVSGNSDLTVNQAFQWDGGDLLGSGQVDAASGVIAGSSTRTLSRTLSFNGGAVDWQQGSIAGSGQLNLNSASVTVQGATNRSVATNVNLDINSNFDHFSTGTTTLSGASVTLDGAVNIVDGTLLLNGTGSSGSGQFQVQGNGVLQVNGGTHNHSGFQFGNGLYQFSGGTTTFSGGGYMADRTQVDGGTVGGDMQTQSLNWTSGAIDGSGVLDASTGTINSSGTVTLNQTLRVGSSMQWADGSISGTGLLEADNGMITVSGTTNRTAAVDTTIGNSGVLFQVSSGTTTLSGANLVNDGAIAIQSGVLEIANANGSGSGQFQTNSGSTIRFTAGSHAYTGTQSGNGTFQFLGGTTSFSGGGYIADITLIDGGTVGGDMQTQDLTWTSGSISGSGVLDAQSGTINATSPLTLSQTLRISGGSTQWQSGSLSGSGLLDIDSGSLEITGLVGRSVATDVNIGASGTLVQFTNAATTISGSSFINDGVVAAQDGVIEISATNGSGGGQFQIVNNGELRFTGGSHAYTGSQSGDGTYRFSGGNVAFSGNNYIADNTVIDGGTVGGDMQTQVLQWSSGSIAGTGTLSTPNATISGPATKTLGQTLNVSGGAVQWQDGSISGSGTLDLDAAFVNVTGSSNRSLSTNVNLDPGTIIVQDSSGTTSISGSSLVFDGIAVVNQGTLSLDATSGNGMGIFQTAAGATLQFNGGNQVYQGQIQGSGDVRVAGGDVTLTTSNIDANTLVVQNGATARLSALATTVQAGSIDNAGTLVVTGATNTTGGMTNSGWLEINGASASLNVNGGLLTQSAGELRLTDGASVGSAALVDIVGGMVTGNGRIDSTLITGASSTIAPGASAGILNVNGPAIIQGDLQIELGGLQVDGLAQVITSVNSGINFSQTEYDQLNIYGSGTITAGSTINLSLINSFLPNTNDFFDIVSADSLAVDLGTISIVTPSSFNATAQVLTLNDPGLGLRDVLRISVTSVPEPTSTAAILLGMIAVGARHRRRRLRDRSSLSTNTGATS